MAPKRTTRSTPVTTTPAPTATTTTSVTNAQLQAMIDQGVIAALAARDANRNGDDSRTSGTGGRRTERVLMQLTWADLRKKRQTRVLEESDKIERSAGNANNANNQRGTGSGQKPTCFECGVQGHYKRECPKLKNNKNCGNQVGYMTGSSQSVCGGTCRDKPRFQYRDGYVPSQQPLWLSYIIDTGSKEVFVSTAFSDESNQDAMLFYTSLVLQNTKNNVLTRMPQSLAHDTTNEFIKGRVVNSKIDPKGGLSPTKVRDEDIPKTVSRTRYGLYEFQNKQEHEEHLKLIQEFLKKEELYAKFSKRKFWIPKVQFLGHVIDSKGIHVDPAKIESIKDWASPIRPTRYSVIF
ncbi:putative reverse transcriptase domain-containing protein [Tanacetum coccineum]